MIDNIDCLDLANPCQEVFEQLAKKNPSKLVAWIKSGTLRPPYLTFAVEIICEVCRTEEAVFNFLSLLHNPSQLVREGALYGLQHHLDDARVKDAIRRVEKEDPSLAVRETAAEILGD